MKYLLCLSVVLCACSTPDQKADRFEKLFSGNMRVVDLTHALSESSPYWPDPAGNPFHYDTLVKQPSGAVAMGRYSTPEHFGTHMDASTHSADKQASVDSLVPEELMGPAVVIDASIQCASDADYALSVQDIMDWEAQNGSIPERAIVIMSTGWDEKWDNYESYKNQDAHGQMHFPGFSVEAARFLVNERNILGIGIDDFSVDAAIADGFPAHSIVNGAGKFHLENVANVSLLPAKGAYLIVAPIKIEGGSGGQVRIFAVVP